MKRSLFRIVSIAAGVLITFGTWLAYGQVDQNYNGWGDTAVSYVTGTATAYTKAFRLSAFENARFDVFARDTVQAGAHAITGDSLQFVWGIQVYHPVYTSTTGTMVYKYDHRIVIDTLDMWSTTPFAASYYTLQLDGSIANIFKTIDTTVISHWACQTRQFAPPWDVYFRFWATGLAQNKKAKAVKLVFQASRRKYVKVGN